MESNDSQQGIWFVYDGACPLCKSAALAYRIKQEYGVLHLINAREAHGHPLISQINIHRLDLDEGMVIYDGQSFYHGKDALVFMARYGDYNGALNVFNALLSRYNGLAAVAYPVLRSMRNLLLRIKKVGRINNI